MTYHRQGFQKYEQIRSKSRQKIMLRFEFLIQSNVFENLTSGEEKSSLGVGLLHPY